MSQRDAIRMTSDEVSAFLAEGSRVRVATLDRNGFPRVVPMAYVMLDGKVVFWADRGSQKVVNLRRDPRIGCVIDDGVDFGELRGVEMTGRVEVLEDASTSERVTELFLAKVPEEWREVARPHLVELAKQRVVVVVHADRVASWDHTKVPGVQPKDIGR